MFLLDGGLEHVLLDLEADPGERVDRLLGGGDAEAQAAASTADFIHKYGTAQREARESAC